MSWLQFPTIGASQITLNVNGGSTDYTFIPANTFDSANLGVVTNALTIENALVVFTSPTVNSKIRSVALSVRVYNIDVDPDVSVVDAVVQLTPEWNASGTAFTGVYYLREPLVLLPELGAATSATYLLSLATPVTWVDPVQTIVRYADQSDATFVY